MIDEEAAVEEGVPSPCVVRRVDYTPEDVGRGVFARTPMKCGTLVELAHCILVNQAEYLAHIKHTVLEHYVFNCRASRDVLVCLGLGSLFNHSDAPNLG